jgi:hypothetical protein
VASTLEQGGHAHEHRRSFHGAHLGTPKHVSPQRGTAWPPPPNASAAIASTTMIAGTSALAADSAPLSRVVVEEAVISSTRYPYVAPRLAKLSRLSTSDPVRAKPKMSAFSAIRSAFADLGMATIRCSMCQRRATCAVVTL